MDFDVFEVEVVGFDFEGGAGVGDEHSVPAEDGPFPVFVVQAGVLVNAHAERCVQLG